MKLAIVVGTRPQIIKLAVLAPALAERRVPFFVVHTGQHYDRPLATGLAEEMGLPPCTYNLSVGSGPVGEQIAEGVRRLLPVLREERASHALVIGDSNPARVGAEAARQLELPLAHCEAGLRSFATGSIEEENRVYADAHTALHLCSSEEDAININNEHQWARPCVTGDLLVDVFATFGPGYPPPPRVSREPLCLFTVHRRENTVDLHRLMNALTALLSTFDGHVAWPVHPRLHRFAADLPDRLDPGLRRKLILSNAVTHRALYDLMAHASLVATDSVGLQVEAYLWKTPCIVMREQLEHRQLLRARASTLLPLRLADRATFASAIQDAFGVDWRRVPTGMLGIPGVASRMAGRVRSMMSAGEAAEVRGDYETAA